MPGACPVGTERQVFLPRPYEDEPLYSVAARYAALLGMTRHMRVMHALFGDARLISIDLPTGLGVLARRCGHGLGLDLGGIVSELTLAPVYLAFVDADLALACRTAMASRAMTNVANLLGLATSRVARTRWLRFCPACAREQRDRVGECHWRRAHQIAGVRACADHGCLLVPSGVPARMAGDRRLHDAETSLPTARDLAASLRPASEAAISIARRCGSLLSRSPERAGVAAGPHRWRRAPGHGLAGREILTAFRDRFGVEELGLVGCDVEPEDPQDWLLRMLRPSEGRYHPLQHVLLELFAEGRPDLVTEREVSPDTGTGSSEGGPARDDRETPDRTRPGTRSAKSPPAAKRHQDQAGLELPEPDGTRRLRHRPGTRHGPQNQRRVDWPRRDDEWAPLLRTAACALRQTRPPRKVTRPAMFAAANLPHGAIDLLERLPRCQTVVAEAVEDVAAFECRKVRWAADELTRLNRPLTPRHIRSLSNLTGPISSRTVTVIEGACRSDDNRRRL
jgi:hypothetical protein